MLVYGLLAPLAGVLVGAHITYSARVGAKPMQLPWPKPKLPVDQGSKTKPVGA